MAAGQHAQWLDSMVLLIAPIYNADGNERVTLTNRGPQNGPIAGMGIRANAQGLNINRDNIKLETPEARSMVKLLNDYDPHVMLDVHTTDGSRHAYHLTWEVPNNPAVDPAITRMASQEWLPAVSQAIQKKDGWRFIPMATSKARLQTACGQRSKIFPGTPTTTGGCETASASSAKRIRT
jgi:hypothetical protein